MLRPRLVLLLTDVLSELSLFFSFYFRFPVLKRHGVFYTSAISEVTWYEPLYNNSVAQPTGLGKYQGNRTIFVSDLSSEADVLWDPDI